MSGHDGIRLSDQSTVRDHDVRTIVFVRFACWGATRDKGCYCLSKQFVPSWGLPGGKSQRFTPAHSTEFKIAVIALASHRAIQEARAPSMQCYFKARSQHGRSMLELSLELAQIRSFFWDAPSRTESLRTVPGRNSQRGFSLLWAVGQQDCCALLPGAWPRLTHAPLARPPRTLSGGGMAMTDTTEAAAPATRGGAG